jgi:Glycosyl transferase family 2
MNITLFAHVLNEQELLPHWLNHHKRLFTHGVILDVGCTDRSMDIVREICPTWEIIQVKPEDTHESRLVIPLIEYHESRFTGWKCCLNITEFLIIDDLQKYLVKHCDKIGFNCTGLISVDNEILDSFNLYDRNFGHLETGNGWDGKLNVKIENSKIVGQWDTAPISAGNARNRLIHQNIKGEYYSGRHYNRLTNDINTDIYVIWVARGYPKYYNRKAINALENTNIIFGPGLLPYYQAFSNLDICIHFWENECRKSYNLEERLPLFKKYIDYHKNL